MPLLRRGRAEPRTLVAALAGAHVRGVPVDWAGFCRVGGRRVDLPTYAFQRQRYWLPAAAGGRMRRRWGRRRRAIRCWGPRWSCRRRAGWC